MLQAELGTEIGIKQRAKGNISKCQETFSLSCGMRSLHGFLFFCTFLYCGSFLPQANVTPVMVDGRNRFVNVFQMQISLPQLRCQETGMKAE